MEIRERILKYLENKGISKYKFYQDTGFSNGFLDKEGTIGADKCEKISYQYPDLNLEWLIIGSGSMLKSDEKSERKRIPFYESDVEAGTMQVSNMDAVTEPDDWIDAGDWFLDADSAMRVHGDSMFPVYKPGSIVVMREVYDKRLIVYGRDYVIQTTEYKVIKRLQKSEITGCWLACSVNDETWEKGDLAGRLIHEPFDVYIDCVTKIFMVLGCVSRNESSKIIYTKNKRI
jgi:hypothetical protein